MDENAKARDLEEQATITRQPLGPGARTSLAPLGESCEPAYDELDLLRGEAAGHRWDGWRRLTGDEAYFAACSCGWRSTETGCVSPMLRQVKEHLDAVRAIRGGRLSTRAAQAPARDERARDASQREMGLDERTRELYASVESQQGRLSQALEQSGDLLSASKDQADRFVAVLEYAAARVAPEWAKTGASVRREQALQCQVERVKEWRSGIVVAAGALAAVAEEVALAGQDLETPLSDRLRLRWAPGRRSRKSARRQRGCGWMTCTVHVAWDERLTDYHFGPGHPLAPVRLELTMRLAREFGLLSQPGVTVAAPVSATDADLELVHDPGYVAAVRTVSRWADELGARGLEAAQQHYARALGLGTGDQPVFAGMHQASALVVGATLAAARAVWPGSAGHGASIAGGMHHAMTARASGYGVYNDVAAAIAWLLGQGAERIAYVDIDAHHGDGVQAAFWSDPRVLTISVHQHPADTFPFTGLPAETGGPGAEGFAVNVALPARTGDARWLRAFHAVIPPLLAQFRPQVLVSQHGADTHRLDPLARLELSIDGQRAAHAAIHTLAHDLAGGRWLLTGGGGYDLVQVVPRSWAHLLAEAAGQPIDPGTPTPASWREHVARRTGLTAPEQMTEGAPAVFRPWESGYDPGHPVDQAIMATRDAVFPLHGLMPV